LPIFAFITPVGHKWQRGYPSLLQGDDFEAYSAGTETKPLINQDAVEVIKEIYGIDMNATQSSKLISDILPVDVVVTMG